MRPAYTAIVEALVDKIARGLVKKPGATRIGARNYLERIGRGTTTGAAFGRAGMHIRKGASKYENVLNTGIIGMKGAQATNKVRFADDLAHPNLKNMTYNQSRKYGPFKEMAFRRELWSRGK